MAITYATKVVYDSSAVRCLRPPWDSFEVYLYPRSIVCYFPDREVLVTKEKMDEGILAQKYWNIHEDAEDAEDEEDAQDSEDAEVSS